VSIRGLIAFGVAAGLSIVAVSANAVAAAGDAPATPSSETSPTDGTGYFQNVYRVADGVWVLAEPEFQAQPIGNVTIIEQSDGLVLVDAGGSAGGGRRIVSMVRSLSPKPVKAVIVSQWHGDKVQGLSEILNAWPHARTIATMQTRAHLSDPATMNTPGAPDAKRNADFVTAQQNVVAAALRLAGKAKADEERRGWEKTARMFQQYAHDVDGTLTIATKESFAVRLAIADAKRPVEAMYLGRANTDGDAVVWLPRQKILVAGETVILPFPYGFKSYPADWLTTLRKMRAMDFRILIPGHGMPQHDRTQIDRIAAALSDVRGQVASLHAQGLSLEDVQARVDFKDQQGRFVGDDPWLGHWFQEYWVHPIIESAFKEAKGEPIVQGLK
jgi:glyoxylase-like metal-dependent hydrolase (beta-lactamase superfamily II)